MWQVIRQYPEHKPDSGIPVLTQRPSQPLERAVLRKVANPASPGAGLAAGSWPTASRRTFELVEVELAAAGAV
jgi:hypothetical protein